MSAYFTTGRTALLAALQAEATLAASVKKWFTWGPGLRRRYDIRPADCPLVSIVPAELDVDQVANVVKAVPQDLEVGMATDGQDATACEELVCAVLDVLAAADRSKLDLADGGLSAIDVLGVHWRTVESRKDARLRWEAVVHVRIHWLRP